MFNGRPLHTTYETLAQKVGCDKQTIKVYLSRPEFRFIKKVRIRKYIYLQGVTNSDINKLKKLIHREKSNGGR